MIAAAHVQGSAPTTGEATMVAVQRSVRLGGVSLLCLVCLLPVAAAAQQQQMASLTGTVFNEHGHVEGGAEITVSTASDQYSATSAADGRFEVQVHADGLSGLVFTARHDAGAQQAYRQLPYRQNAQPPTEPIRLVLRPAREVVANVVDKQGQPVAGALVTAMAGFRNWEARTDSLGRAKCLFPRDAKLRKVFAFKPEVGLDYVEFRPDERPGRNPYELPQDHSESLSFVLDGLHTVTVRVLDEKNRPVAGVEVVPWLLAKPKKGGVLDVSNLDTFKTTTDSQGIATLATIPLDNPGSVTVWIRMNGRFAPERRLFAAASPAKEFTINMKPLVPVTGRIVHQDGRPASGIRVHAIGSGYSGDDFREMAQSDDGGKFQLGLAPDQFYLFVLVDSQWAAPAQTRVVRAGTPVDSVDFTLGRGTRVHGQLTVGGEHSPSLAKLVVLSQRPSVAHDSLPDIEKLPRDHRNSKKIVTVYTRTDVSDDQGRFEFLVGPGNYDLKAPDSSAHTEFVIAQQSEFELNLHVAGYDSGPITGRVVSAQDPSQGISGAAVNGAAVQMLMRWLRTTTDAEGRFEAQRGLSDMLVHAGTPDRRQGGIVNLTPNDKEVVIPVGPTASVEGRLIDHETGLPLIDHPIDYGVRIDFADKDVQPPFRRTCEDRLGRQFQVGGPRARLAVRAARGTGEERLYQPARLAAGIDHHARPRRSDRLERR